MCVCLNKQVIAGISDDLVGLGFSSQSGTQLSYWGNEQGEVSKLFLQVAFGNFFDFLEITSVENHSKIDHRKADVPSIKKHRKRVVKVEKNSIPNGSMHSSIHPKKIPLHSDKEGKAELSSQQQTKPTSVVSNNPAMFNAQDVREISTQAPQNKDYSKIPSNVTISTQSTITVGASNIATNSVNAQNNQQTKSSAKAEDKKSIVETNGSIAQQQSSQTIQLRNQPHNVSVAKPTVSANDRAFSTTSSAANVNNGVHLISQPIAPLAERYNVNDEFFSLMDLITLSRDTFFQYLGSYPELANAEREKQIKSSKYLIVIDRIQKLHKLQPEIFGPMLEQFKVLTNHINILFAKELHGANNSLSGDEKNKLRQRGEFFKDIILIRNEWKQAYEYIIANMQNIREGFSAIQKHFDILSPALSGKILPYATLSLQSKDELFNDNDYESFYTFFQNFSASLRLKKDDKLYAQAENQIGVALDSALEALSGVGNDQNFNPETVNFNSNSRLAPIWLRNNLRFVIKTFENVDPENPPKYSKQQRNFNFSKPELKDYREELILKSEAYYALYRQKYAEIKKVEDLMDVLIYMDQLNTIIALRNNPSIGKLVTEDFQVARLFEYFDFELPSIVPQYNNAKAEIITKLKEMKQAKERKAAENGAGG